MTRTPQGRGPHRDDARDLGPDAVHTLREAALHIQWMLDHGYAESAIATFVGDRFQLSKRQRMALQRSTCSTESLARRRANAVIDLAGRDVHIDGFNVLIPVERALGGGPLLRGMEGAYRDLGGVHGTWRSVAHTPDAIAAVAPALATAASVTWWLDRPVSNSGRLAGAIRECAASMGLDWAVSLHDRVDSGLAAAQGVIATSDGWILEQDVPWVDLIGPSIPDDAWVVDFR